MKEKIKKNKIYLFLKRPLNICIIYLVCMTAFAVNSRLSDDISNIKYFIFSLSLISIFSIYIPWILTLKKIKLFNISDSIISGLILFLVVDPNQSIFNLLIICIFYFLARCFIRYKNSPIFNPVVISIILSLIASSFLKLDLSVSWWGVSFSPRFSDFNISIAILLTAPFGIYFLKKFNKFYIFLSAFILSSTFFLLFNSMQNINNSSLLSMYISTFIEGTLFFALFIMLVEPKTSPVKKIPQIAFGIVFYLTWIILTNINVSNALIFSIFAANIYNFLQKFIENLIRIHFPKKVISPVLSTIQN